MPGLKLLGDISQWEGPQVAGVGRWLVVFKHNSAVRLHRSGVKVRKLFAPEDSRVPTIGASVALLDTSPQSLDVEINNAESADSYVIPRIRVEIQVRLAPENPQIAELLLERINRDGEKFFDSIEAGVHQHVEQLVRHSIRSQHAHKIIELGPRRVAFPQEPLVLPAHTLIEVTALQKVEWTEDEFSRSVREREAELAAARALHEIEEEQNELDRQKRERAAKAEEHAIELEGRKQTQLQKNEGEIARLQLRTQIDRARDLGVDPLAIAERDVWEQFRRDHTKIAEGLMASQNLFQVARTNPDLMRSIFDRLSGSTVPGPMTRQADMVLDSITPQFMPEVESVRIPGADDSALQALALTAEPTISWAWISSGGQASLTGAGLTLHTEPGSGATTAWVLLMTAELQPVPVSFKNQLEAELVKKGVSGVEVRVQKLTGRSVSDAISSAVGNLSSSVRTSATLRGNGGNPEVLVRLEGEAASVRRTYEWLNDPANLTVPTLEQFVGQSARIRFFLPGA